MRENLGEHSVKMWKSEEIMCCIYAENFIEIFQTMNFVQLLEELLKKVKR